MNMQDSTNAEPVHRALLLSFSHTLAPILNPPCCAAPIKACFCPVFDLNIHKVIQQVMMSESRGEAVSAAVSLLYTGSCSLSKVSNTPKSTSTVLILF